ncbi:MAG: hypothetical protein ACRDJM_08975 [Actinomycetota bacterium]
MRARSVLTVMAVIVTAGFAILPAPAAGGTQVGYYDMCSGAGNASQVASITAAGGTAVNITDPTAAQLAPVDVFYVQNCNNGAYGAEYVSRLADIAAWVGGGGVLIIHDRFVANAETILPGGAGFNIVRDFTQATDINIRTAGTRVTSGPGGIVTNTNLDGGNFSNHGWGVEGSLPANGTFILSATTPTNSTTFCYPRVLGAVVYSTIPLDFYLAGAGTQPNFRTIYAPNVVRYGIEGACALIETTLTARPAIADLVPGADVFLTLSAVLTETATGNPVAGETVDFSIGATVVCSGTTDAAGVAACGGPIELLGSLTGGGFSAAFGGSSTHAESSDTGNNVTVNGIEVV